MVTDADIEVGGVQLPKTPILIVELVTTDE